MITYEEFKQELINSMNDMANNSDIVTGIHTGITNRTNMNEAECLTVSFVDGNVSPTAYIEELYAEYLDGYATIPEIARTELRKLEEAHNAFPQMDLDSFKSRIDTAAIFLQLINRERNESIRESCAHIAIADLIAVPKYRMQINNEVFGSILITRDIQTNLFQMTDDELLSLARANTQNQNYIITDIGSVVSGMMGYSSAEDIDIPKTPGVFVITNESMTFGASAMISQKCMQQDLPAKLGGNGNSSAYLIPSSVHELIAISEDAVADPAELKDICHSVNESCLEPKDYLSSNIYYYDGIRHKIEICNSLEDLEQIKSYQLQQNSAQSQSAGRKVTI